MESRSVSTTGELGQGLVDLQKALEKDVITEEEYKESEKRLLKERTKPNR